MELEYYLKRVQCAIKIIQNNNAGLCGSVKYKIV